MCLWMSLHVLASSQSVPVGLILVVVFVLLAMQLDRHERGWRGWATGQEGKRLGPLPYFAAQPAP
jgi:hypothetical protein